MYKLLEILSSTEPIISTNLIITEHLFSLTYFGQQITDLIIRHGIGDITQPIIATGLRCQYILITDMCTDTSITETDMYIPKTEESPEQATFIRL